MALARPKERREGGHRNIEGSGMEPLNYNRMAGKNIGRLEALSDGVFAVALTILVLDLKTPVAGAIHGEGICGRRWRRLGPGWSPI